MDGTISPQEPSARLIGFLNFAHALDHFVMLIYPAVVLALSGTFSRAYGDLLPFSLGGFVAFGAFSMPFGWLGKWLHGHTLIAAFFFGTGLSCIAAGLAQGPWQIAAALTFIGLFAAIYHPIGNAMLAAADPARLGRVMGRNGLWGNMGVASAALASGVLTDFISWRAAFIVPGAAALAAGVVFLAFVADPGPLRTTPRERHIHAIPRAEVARVFVILAVSTMAGALIFSATTIAMPKLFEERLAALTSTVSGVGLAVFITYSLAALAQISVGALADRFPLARIFVPLAVLQVPLLLLTGFAVGAGTFFAALPMMFVVFGLVPVNEVLTARYTAPELRTRVYAVRYSLAFAATATAIPLVSILHKTYGGFAEVFATLAGVSLILVAAALVYAQTGRNTVAVSEPAAV
jgi:MFS family permease